MKQIARSRRHRRVTKKIKGTTERPRLVVFRSKKHMYAQIVDDSQQKVIAGCSTLGKIFLEKANSKKEEKTATLKISGREAAKRVGGIIAKVVTQKGIKKVSFDRGGYKYHGRVKSLADGAREGGLQF